MHPRPHPRLLALSAIFCASVTTGCATTPSVPEPVEEIRPGILAGYLPMDSLPSSLKLLPPPPAEGSLAYELDRELNAQLLTLQGSPRFEQAALDNDLSFPNAAAHFSCAVGISITPMDTPFLYQLLRRSLADAGLATYTAKNHYQRRRPFLVNEASNCAPEREQAMLAEDGSYPSGHTAIGWAWALILSTLAPERAEAILIRGMTYGESRAICNVHWPSDVVAGRTVGAAAVALLQADATFLRDLQSARKEIADARVRGLTPERDCDAELEVLAKRPYAAE
jgi:acid phosphatase (class A)